MDGMKSYAEFLKGKGHKVTDVGFESKEVNPLLFDWQTDVVHWALRKGRAAIFSECGTGKGQPYGSKVLTTAGWTNIEQLKPGDMVYASDGEAYPVTGVFPKGELETYRFYYGDRTSLVFDIDHLHIVRTQNEKQKGKPWKVMSTKELIAANNLRYGKNGKSRNYSVPLVKPVQHTEKDFTVHPYVIGALIGNGTINGAIRFSSADAQTVANISERLPDGVSIKHKYKYEYSIITGPTGNVRHPFREEIIRLGLYGKHSFEKFIPLEYMDGSVTQRAELLRGLMDTDGCITNGSCQYYTASEQLAKDVLNLVWSLGGYGTISRKKAGYKKNDEEIPCLDSYTVYVALDDINPFLLERKASKWKPHARDIGRYIDRLEFEGVQKTVCISVDSPDHSYVTENYLVTHNTSLQLQWAHEVSKHTNMPVLILAPLAVAQQTKREGDKFHVPVTVCRTQGDVKPGVNVTNYEMLEHFEPEEFGGVVLDESGILKAFMGKTKRMLVKAFENTAYKLACTATPSPNDQMELLNQAEYLGVMRSSEALAIWFIADQSAMGTYRLKKHAEEDFWDWVSSWAVCFEKPSDLGNYSDEGYDLPPLREHDVIIKIDEIAENFENGFLRDIETSATGYHREKKVTLKKRCDKCKEIVESSDEQALVWCGTNEEADYLKKIMPYADEVRGSDSREKKETAAMDFADGKTKVLISKSSIFGFGLNFQQCSRAIFCGMDYSYEGYYQAVRRLYRFGQTKPVDIYRVMGSTEHNILDTINRKQTMRDEMHTGMLEALKRRDTVQEKKHYQAVSEGERTIDVPDWLRSEKAS